MRKLRHPHSISRSGPGSLCIPASGTQPPRQSAVRAAQSIPRINRGLRRALQNEPAVRSIRPARTSFIPRTFFAGILPAPRKKARPQAGSFRPASPQSAAPQKSPVCKGAQAGSGCILPLPAFLRPRFRFSEPSVPSETDRPRVRKAADRASAHRRAAPRLRRAPGQMPRKYRTRTFRISSRSTLQIRLRAFL